MAHDDTVELPTFTRAIGGTDEHPADIAALLARIDAQADLVWSAATRRGTAAGADELAATAHELGLLAQSLEGRAGEEADRFRSTAAAVLDESPDGYEAVMDRIHGGTE